MKVDVPMKKNKYADKQNKILYRIQELISDNLYMTIATSNNKGEPWISNVYFVCDDEFNLYWYSSKKTQHSQLINSNPKIAFCIFNSTAVGDDVDAVYGKANVEEVEDRSNLLQALTLYAKKMLKTGFISSIKQLQSFVRRYKDFLGDSELRLYKATPTEISKLAPSKMYNDKYIDSREILF